MKARSLKALKVLWKSSPVWGTFLLLFAAPFPVILVVGTAWLVFFTAKLTSWNKKA